MRVFVLTTGRAASTTFAHACRHIDGMTSAHESRSRCLEGRLDYPDNHVEVDNRLAWFLGGLDRKYEDNNTFYVHLIRSPKPVSSSYVNRWNVQSSILRAFYYNILMRNSLPTASEKHKAGELMVQTINENIDSFLKGRENFAVVRLENIKEDFLYFVKKAGLSCDLDLALREFDVVTNRNKSLISKFSLRYLAKKAYRFFRWLPEYIRYV